MMRDDHARTSRNAAACLVTVLLAGCASYAPRPLPQQPALIVDAASLKHEVASAHGAMSHRFDPGDGFDATELAMAAVATSPKLRAARARRGVATAQLYAAGLLPDPQLSTSLDIPTSNGPMLFNAYSAGVTSDIISSLITRGARVSGAQNALRQVNLDVLWQEWQVAQQARTLYATLYFLDRKIVANETMLKRYRQRYARSAKALARGDLTLDVTGTDLTAVLGAASQLSQLRQTQAQKRQNLATLLGLAPDVRIALAKPVPYSPMPKAQARAREADVVRRRPDLLALKAGYQSQEAKVREAILGQFPAVTAGINRASDTSNVRTLGFSIGITLPLFSANRGAIASARATRAQLRAEYRQRVDSLPSTIAQLLDTQSILLEQKTS